MLSFVPFFSLTLKFWFGENNSLSAELEDDVAVIFGVGEKSGDTPELCCFPSPPFVLLRQSQDNCTNLQIVRVAKTKK